MPKGDYHENLYCKHEMLRHLCKLGRCKKTYV